MASKNETPALVAALLVTIGILGGAGWFLYQNTDIFGSSASAPDADPRNSPAPNGADPASTGASNPTNSPAANVAAEVATLAQVANVPAGLFNYGGSTTWAPIRGQVDPQIKTVWPQFELRYTSPITGNPGSSSGILMLLDGQLDFAQSSRALRTEDYEQAQQRGFTLTQIPVALEGIALAVNPSLAVTGLTLTQVQQIYTGEITNWSQVGGPNLPITPLSRSLEAGGTVEFFVENVLGGRSLGNTVEIVPNTTQALRRLAAVPGGIYYGSGPEIVPQCTVKPIAIAGAAGTFVAPYLEPYVPESACPAQRNQINTTALRSGEYPITRQLFVIVKQNGQAEQQAGEAYAQLLLSGQGQDLISESGFVKIR